MTQSHNCWMPADFTNSGTFVNLYASRSSTASKLEYHADLDSGGKYKEYRYSVGGNRILATRRTLEGREPFYSPHTGLRDLSYVMTNATTCGASDLRRLEHLISDYPHLKVLQDSGGYQLFSGVRDFIHPKEVADAHAKLPDKHAEGVGLDVPLGAAPMTKGTALRAARFQADNNMRIRDEGYLGPLLDTSHGRYAETRIQYLEALIKHSPNNRIDNLAIAGLRGLFGVYSPTLEQMAATATYVIRRAKPKRVHLLGLASRSGFLLAHLIRKAHPEVVLTMDSSTYAMMAASGFWIASSLAHGTQSGNGSSKPQLVNCHCSVCSHFGRYFTLSSLGRGPLIKIHNLQSLIAHGRLDDPVLSTWASQAKYAEVVSIVNAPDRDLESNLRKHCTNSRSQASMFNSAKHVKSPYEDRVVHVMDVYRSKLKRDF